MSTPESKQDRVACANMLLRAIASVGRQFFAGKDGRVTQFELDARGRVWLIDKWRGDRIYTHYEGRWRGFTEGGTLRYLCTSLRDYIKTGETIRASHFGPWPQSMCKGDPWGYGDAIEHVRSTAEKLGIVPTPASRSASPSLSED